MLLRRQLTAYEKWCLSGRMEGELVKLLACKTDLKLIVRGKAQKKEVLILDALLTQLLEEDKVHKTSQNFQKVSERRRRKIPQNLLEAPEARRKKKNIQKVLEAFSSSYLKSLSTGELRRAYLYSSVKTWEAEKHAFQLTVPTHFIKRFYISLF